MSAQWQRVERPVEDLMVSDERSLIAEAYRKAFYKAPGLQSQLRARGQLGDLSGAAQGFADGMVAAMEQLLIRDGWANYARENGFWAAWDGYAAEHGQVSKRGTHWLPSSRLELGSSRGGGIVAGLDGPGLSEVIRVAVEAGVRAAQPDVTESEVAVLDEAGNVTKRSTVVTKRSTVVARPLAADGTP